MGLPAPRMLLALNRAWPLSGPNICATVHRTTGELQPGPVTLVSSRMPVRVFCNRRVGKREVSAGSREDCERLPRAAYGCLQHV
jgi:hypothetical protein